jgi:hypothetical protein
MKCIIAPFVLDKQEYQDAAGDACRQSGDIDKAVHFMLDKVTQGDGKVVFEHDLQVSSF